MTNDTTVGAGPTEHNLTAVQQLLQVVRELLLEKVHRLRQGEDIALKEVDGNITLMTRLALKTLDEEARLDAERQRAAGAANGYAVDFATARVEIGRRLDCLRRAGDRREVPEGTE